MATFYVPAINLIGIGCIKELGSNVKELGYKKALFVTDNFLAKSEMIDVVLAELDNAAIDYVIYADVDPNPTCKNVNEGVAMAQAENCDFIISLRWRLSAGCSERHQHHPDERRQTAGLRRFAQIR